MYKKNEHKSQGDQNTRFIVSGESVESLVYRSWTAQSVRQVKKTQRIFLFTSEKWVDDGTPLTMAVEFQDGSGTSIPNPATITGNGVVTVSHWAAGVLPGTETVTSIASMRIAYTFEHNAFEIVIGRDWIRPAVIILAIIVIIVIIVVIALIAAA